MGTKYHVNIFGIMRELLKRYITFKHPGNCKISFDNEVKHQKQVVVLLSQIIFPRASA